MDETQRRVETKHPVDIYHYVSRKSRSTTLNGKIKIEIHIHNQKGRKQTELYHI